MSFIRGDLQSAVAERISKRRYRRDGRVIAEVFPDAGRRPGGFGRNRRRSSQPFAGAARQIRTWIGAPVLTAHSFPVLAAAFEFVVLTLATFGAGALYHYLAFRHMPSPLFYLIATICLVALFVGQSGFARDYSLKRLPERREQIGRVFLRWNSAYSLFVFALFMIQATDFYSRGSVVIQYAVGLLTALAVRLLMARFVAGGLRAGAIRGRKVIVIGQPPMTADVMRRLGGDAQGIKIVEILTLDSVSARNGHIPMRDPAEVAEETADVLRRVTAIARESEIDDIVIALPWFETERIRALVEGLAAVPATIQLAPDRRWGWLRDPVLTRVGQVHTVRLARAPLTLRDRFVKRAFDVAAASALLVLLAPVMAVIAALIKLETPGPAFFRQRRNGFNQREFRVVKFRTMTTLDDGHVVRQAVRNDSRITKIGRILRRTNLDELPQLFNVLAGDMSLVGPRPHAVAHNNAFEEQIRLYARRHNVKPGITGWAQVHGYRGETDVIEKMIRRVECDLYYIDHWSLFMDIRILLMTVFSARAYRNAY
jgi:Undecaprenyl-phosphate glucose phosphotransferase